MSSLQEALNQRKRKLETAISTKVSASGKKKSGVRRRSDPSSPKPQEHQAHRRSFSA